MMATVAVAGKVTVTVTVSISVAVKVMVTIAVSVSVTVLVPVTIAMMTLDSEISRHLISLKKVSAAQRLSAYRHFHSCKLDKFQALELPPKAFAVTYMQ